MTGGAVTLPADAAGLMPLTSGQVGVAAAIINAPDPTAIAEWIVAIATDQLRESFVAVVRANTLMVQGDELATQAQHVVAGAWSNAAPGQALGELRGAAELCRGVLEQQSGAVESACAVLDRIRHSAAAEVRDADAELSRVGVPHAGSAEQSPEMMTTVAPVLLGLHARLAELRDRAESTLSLLADDLRADPRDAVESLPTLPREPSAHAGGIASGDAPGHADTPAGAVDAKNLAELRDDLNSSDASTRAMAEGVWHALEQARAAGDPAQLLIYESANGSSQGRAAISVGDLTTADHVGVYAPGSGSAPVSMESGVALAADLRAEAQRQAPGESTAVVAWYGYDAPLSAVQGVSNDFLTTGANTLALLDGDNARAGGAWLLHDLHQFQQLAPTARFTALGFSMGATTVSEAAARGADLDDLVLMGSPGVGTAQSTADYAGVPQGHTFNVAFEDDPVTHPSTDLLASALSAAVEGPSTHLPYGGDPIGSDFGARQIDVRSNVPDVEIHGAGLNFLTAAATNRLADLHHHSEANYLAGDSLNAVASVVVGRYTDVPVRDPR